MIKFQIKNWFPLDESISNSKLLVFIFMTAWLRIQVDIDLIHFIYIEIQQINVFH